MVVLFLPLTKGELEGVFEEMSAPEPYWVKD